MSRIYLLTYQESKEQEALNKAKDFAIQTVENAEGHFAKDSPFYSRVAVSYMQLSEVYIETQEYEKALSLLDQAYDIMVSLFGEDDPDSLNVASRKSQVLYYLGRYNDALSIGQKNLDTYTRFYGELNFLRFEQLIIVLKCHIALGNNEQAQSLKENALKIAKQLLAEDSPQLKEIMSL